ncbi:hypothetical protein KEJ45_01035 [Candidatus Bathyarchaeota archaeon]|nr:hypothetical protein [Candidatus Bathyarchaeota archaeon]
MLEFKKTVKYAKILNPLKNFEEDTVVFEYRTDPITGRNTTVINGMLNYISKFLVSEKELLGAFAEKTRINCPFCPENVKTKTPLFTPDFLKEGRIFVGDATVIPNLLGHAEKSVLVILTKEHYLQLKDFKTETLLNGFKGALTYLKRLKEKEPIVKFPVFIFNYLPPAGSSIFHPHMQVLARDRPFYLTQLLLEKSKAYFKKYGSNVWTELVSNEKTHGERYLYGKNGVEWLVPFAPLRGLNEAQAVVTGKSNFLEMEDGEWREIAEGTVKILKFYYEQGYTSFNMVLLSGPLDTHLDYFNVNLRIISRPGMQASSFTDAWALPYLLWDGEAVESPEQLAKKLRDHID